MLQANTALFLGCKRCLFLACKRCPLFHLPPIRCVSKMCMQLNLCGARRFEHGLRMYLLPNICKRVIVMMVIEVRF